MPTLIAIIFVAACFLAWFYKQKTNVDERKLLIEKGFDPSQLPDRRTFNFSFPWLKMGCVITGAAAGAIMGFAIATYLDKIGESSSAGPVFLICIFLMGGIGMIIAHYIDKPGEKT